MSTEEKKIKWATVGNKGCEQTAYSQAMSSPGIAWGRNNANDVCVGNFIKKFDQNILIIINNKHCLIGPLLKVCCGLIDAAKGGKSSCHLHFTGYSLPYHPKLLLALAA